MHRIIITAESPLVFPERKPGLQYAETLGYIPGAVIWGGLGLELGVTPSARFSNALPSFCCDEWVRVLPATAMSCKLHSGFKRIHADHKCKRDEDEYHGVFDTLIDHVCWHQLQPAVLTYDPHCPVCYGLTKSFSGFYAKLSSSNGNQSEYQTRSVQKRILTRVAVDRKRNSAAEAMLYSPVVISEVNSHKGSYTQTRFLGWAWGLDDDACKQLMTYVRAIGGRISSGLGRVQITATPVEEPSTMKARLEQFHKRFQERWQLFCDHLQPQRTRQELGWSPDEWTVFTVGLQSEALLVEHGWQPSMVFSAAQLWEQTGLDAKLVESQATSKIIGGWNISWDRHKPTAIAATAGSVYLFRTQASKEDIVKALEQLEREGIGQRREEGYGIVRCCDEFHSEATGNAI